MANELPRGLRPLAYTKDASNGVRTDAPEQRIGGLRRDSAAPSTDETTSEVGAQRSDDGSMNQPGTLVTREDMLDAKSKQASRPLALSKES